MDTMSYLLGKNASGGGGGSTGSDVFIVTATENGGKYTIDKTYEEIVEAKNSGKLIVYTDGITSGFLHTFPGLPGMGMIFSGYMIYTDALGLNVKTVNISDMEVNVHLNTYTLTPVS